MPRAPSRAAASASTPKRTRAVAGDARVGGAAGGVPGDEVLDHPSPEALRHVEGEVRDAEGVGAGAGEPRRSRGAAGALRGGGRGVVPEAHRHADDVQAGVAEQHRGDGAVHAAAHRNRDPPRGERDPRVADPGGEPRLERAGDGVLHQLGAVAPGLAEAAEVGVECAPPRGAARRRASPRPAGRTRRWRPPSRRRSRTPGTAPRGRAGRGSAGGSGRGHRTTRCRTRRRRPPPPSPPHPSGDARWRIASGG